MSANIQRIIGVVIMAAAVVVAVLNLKRVADLGMPWLSSVLLVIGLGFMVNARRRK
jgi:hypothetical protein